MDDEETIAMKYDNIREAVFIERPNRFVAYVDIDGKREKVHVKNTGRCKELLIPGVKVWVTAPGTPGRKTKYDLVAVEKQGLGIVNIDSQAPNKVVREWLDKQDYDVVKPEYTWGNSRFDFYVERVTEKTLIEVKGCTLEIDGIGYFPDAPTERGVKHLRELASATGEGYRAILMFVIQMEGIVEVRPNIDTHPEFGIAMEEAAAAGVEIMFMPCKVSAGELRII